MRSLKRTLVAALLALGCGSAFAQSGPVVACPPVFEGRRAAASEVATLYHGTPAAMESQAPGKSVLDGKGGWVNTWQLVHGGNGFTVACHYEKGPDLVLTLAATVKQCRQDRHTFACH